MYTRCGWQRLGHGAYVDAATFAELEAAARHRLRIEATLPAMATDAILSHESAAVMYKLPLWRVPLDRIQITRDRRNGGRIKHDLTVHCGPVVGVVEIDGFLVTTPARMVVDLGRTLPFEQAVVTGDAAVRTFGVTAEDLAVELELAKYRRGAAAARRVVNFLDGRSESVGESRSRVMLRRCGIDGMLSQGIVFDAGGVARGRVDFYDEELGVLGEFDGRVKYGRLLRQGQDPGDAVFEEKLREDRLREPGFQVVRWIWDELENDSTGVRIAQSLERGRKSPAPDGRIERAPLPKPCELVIRSL